MILADSAAYSSVAALTYFTLGSGMNAAGTPSRGMSVRKEASFFHFCHDSWPSLDRSQLRYTLVALGWGALSIRLTVALAGPTGTPSLNAPPVSRPMGTPFSMRGTASV